MRCCWKLLLPTALAASLATAVHPPQKRHHLAPNRRSGEKTAMAWYSSWHMKDFPLDRVPWSMYDIVAYACAIPTQDPSKVELAMGDQDATNVVQFVQTAHQHNVSAVMLVGGWTGSRYFSTVLASEDSRATFANTMVELINTYNLDGLDFDWEYPGSQSTGCNTVSSSDTSNFLSFFQLLRSKLPATTILTAAVSPSPWVGLNDLSGFAPLLNYIIVMTYDFYPPAAPGVTQVGPNSPLDESCMPQGALVMGSATKAIKAWSDAGISKKQLLLGVPAYGHSYRVPTADAIAPDGTLKITSSFDPHNQTKGDAWDDPGGVDVCGNTIGPGGVWTFWGLVQAGYLNEDGTHSSSVQYKWDNCSQTPMLYDSSKQMMVSYDDPESFRAKGTFVVQNDLGGYAMWEAGGDYNNLLVQAISSEVKPTGLSPGTTTLSGLGTVTISSTGLVVTQTSNGSFACSPSKPMWALYLAFLASMSL